MSVRFDRNTGSVKVKIIGSNPVGGAKISKDVLFVHHVKVGAIRVLPLLLMGN